MSGAAPPRGGPQRFTPTGTGTTTGLKRRPLPPRTREREGGGGGGRLGGDGTKHNESGNVRVPLSGSCSLTSFTGLPCQGNDGSDSQPAALRLGPTGLAAPFPWSPTLTTLGNGRCVTSLTPSLPQPVKKFRAERCTDSPANSIFPGPIATHPLSVLCVLMKVLSHASAKKKT